MHDEWNPMTDLSGGLESRVPAAATPTVIAPHQISPVVDSGTTDRLRFVAGQTPLADYVFVPEDIRRQSPRPYFDELRTLGGHLVSESYPDDHPWHRGLSWALPVVNNENFWGGPSFVRDSGYVQLENNGIQRHRGFAHDAAPGPGGGTAGDPVWFAENLAWFTEAGDHVIDERRTVSMSVAAQDSWVLTFTTVMANVTAGVLSFGSPTTKGRPNGGYGGLFWRGPAQFTDAQAISPHGTGDDDMRGTRAPWMGLSGYAGPDGAGVTVVVVDGPQNERTPPEWFVRTEEYPCLCPGPFFSAEYELASEAALRLDYAVVIADGASDPGRGAALAGHGYAALARLSGH
jgi:hypothetical protein